MEHSQILIKTAKGQEEIRTRAFNLSHGLRHLLILIDGHSTVGETLARLEGQGEDTEGQLEALLADGFLAPHPSAFEMGAGNIEEWYLLADENPSLRDAAPAGVPIPEQPRFNLEKAKGYARFVILGSLGPVGSHRLERIEAATTAGELRAELDELRDVLPKLLSKHQAKEVWEHLEPLMLSFN